MLLPKTEQVSGKRHQPPPPHSSNAVAVITLKIEQKQALKIFGWINNAY
ncbi:hypothetical protein [Desulfogranum marinum]|nr:hypothetical protein [Desulfogranum marinum]MBM9515022.1 hypothetical protein [Desulfogranum marinum]